MIVKSELSKKYAQAYYHVYSSSLQPSSIHALEKASNFLSHSKEILFLLGYGSLNSQEVRRCIQLFIQRFALPETIEKIFILLFEHTRIFLLESVLHDICCIYKKEHNEIDVALTSAHNLTAEQIADFKDFFTLYSKSNVTLHVVHDPSLIAGVRMQSEMWLWENSVAKKIRALKQNVLL